MKTANVNDFAAGTTFNRITYAGAGYNTSGNRIELTGGIVVSHGAGNTILNLPVTLAADQTFTVSLAEANLFLNGEVQFGRSRSVLTFDGAGQIVVSGNVSGGLLIAGGAMRKNGAGTLWILQHLTLAGTTTVNGGALRVDGSLSNSAVTVNAGATLLGTGKVGGIMANAGGIVSPGAATPAILESLGDVTLNAGSTLTLRLNGTSAGLNYDQLRVQGAVTLGGTLNVTAGFVPAVGERFTLIANDGIDDVVGTFAGLPEGAVLTINGRPFRISYGARGLGGFGRDVNDVTLEALPGLSVWDGGGGQNKFWSQPLNWVGDVAPMPGDDLQFSSSGPGTLITSNDFPAGRAIGSIRFVGGNHLLGGNPAEINGGLRVDAGDEAGAPYRHTEIAMPLVLGASQTFAVNYSNAVLYTEAPIDLGTYNLTVETHVAYSYISTEYSQVTIQGGVLGLGTLIKNGPGNLSLLSPSTCAHTIVNGGAFRLSSFSPSAMSGSVTVNAGATLEADDDIGGDVTVNSAGVLRGFSAFLGGNVEINGGTFESWQSGIIAGNLRLLNGATYGATVRYASSPDFAFPNGAQVRGTVELGDCALNLRFDPADDFNPAGLISILSYTNNGRVGTFVGLPDGAHVTAGGRLFGLHYLATAATLFTDEPFTWDGGGNGNLCSTGSNWVADFPPLPGSALRFPAGVPKLGVLNDFSAGTAFQSFTFEAPSYVVAGNPFQLTAGLYNDTATGETLISADWGASGNPFECRVNEASRLILDGRLSGGSVWRKTGSGTLRFRGTGPNTHPNVQVWAGQLELAKSPGVAAIAALLGIGDGTNAAVVALLDDHQIADTAEVAIRAPARFDLNGNVEAIDTLSGDGLVDLSERLLRGARLTVARGNFAGTIIGGGGLTKVGTDTSVLTLSGTSPFSGTTVLNGGILSVDGVQTNSPIQLNGGLLRGRGDVGAIAANLGGVVQPGFAGAAFQNRLHSRDVAFNAATTFRPMLTGADPDFENSQLQVTGAVSLGGSTLDLELLFVPSPGRSFVILDNDRADAVVGTFAGLPEGAEFTRTGLRWRITYAGGDGNDVALTLLQIDFRPRILSFTADLLSRPGYETDTLLATGVPRAIYDVQRSTNLLNWTTLLGQAANGEGMLNLNFSSLALGPQEFYRLKLR